MPFGSSVPFVEPMWYSRPGIPHYKPSHERLRHAVRAYMEEHVNPFWAEWEEQGFIPREVMKRHSEHGYTAVLLNPTRVKDYLGDVKLPGDVDPGEWDGFHELICIDEIARCGSLGVVWGLGCGDSVGCPPVVNFGTLAQKNHYLPSIISGDVRFCLAITEPEAGSDVANITTTAKRRGDVYIVNGAKKWITNGIFADYCTTAVRTGAPGQGGISVLVIPMNSKGITRRPVKNSGVSSSGSTYIEFDDVEVPVSNRLGNENEGFKIIMSNFNHERIWLACTSLGLARVCVADAYAHAITRETFGKTLISNQVIRAKFSNMAALIHPCHAFMESIVAMLTESRAAGRHADAELGGMIALLKVQAARTLEFAVRESQQVMGGLGYSRTGKGARIEQISRDVRPLVVGGGSDEILTELAFKQELRDLEALVKGDAQRNSKL